MTAMFAMVASDHQALMDLYHKAGTQAELTLLWQNAECMIGSYGTGNARQNVRQFSFVAAHAVINGCDVPDNAQLSTQITNQPAAISRCIPGAHTVFCWSAATKQLIASRDPLNQHSLYFARLGNVTVISSEASFIARLMPIKPPLNPAALACWLAGTPNPALCLYANIHALPLGYALEAGTQGALNEHKFWDIDPQYTLNLATDDAYRASFAELLDASVRSHIADSDNVVVSQMSGGMDSTSITALAHRIVGPDKQCRPLSHLYSQSASCDESENIQAMVEHLKLTDPIQLTVDAGANRDFLSLYPTDFDSPGTVLSPRYHQECDIIRASGSRRLLTGNGGDEMCWGHASAYTQRLRQGEFGVIKEVVEACKQTDMAVGPVLRSLFVKPMLPNWLLETARRLKRRQSADMPVWLTSKATKLVRETGTVENPFHPRKQPVGYARYQALKTTSTYNSLRSYQKVAWQYGIEVAHPFFDSRIAAFSFAVPPQQLIRGAYPKWVLRTAMDNLLPESVCWNVQKVTFDNHFGQLIKDNAASLRALLEDTRLQEMGLLNNASLLASFDETVANSKAHVHVDLLYAILTQRWIQQHH